MSANVSALSRSVGSQVSILILDAQTGNQSAVEELARQFGIGSSHPRSHPLRRIVIRASRKSGLVYDDDFDDVVSETIVQILDPNVVRFDPSKGSADAYLLGLALNSAKTIRRLRRQITSMAENESRHEKGLHHLVETIAQRSDTIDPASVIADREERLKVLSVITQLIETDKKMADVLDFVRQGCELTEIGKKYSVHRSTIRRWLDKFAVEVAASSDFIFSEN